MTDFPPPDHPILEQVADAMVLTDLSGVVSYANPAAAEQSGYARTALVGARFDSLAADAHQRGLIAEIWPTVARGDVWRGRLKQRRPGPRPIQVLGGPLKVDVHAYWVDATFAPIRDAQDGTISSCAATLRDISMQVARRQVETLDAEAARVRAEIGEVLQQPRSINARMHEILGLLMAMEGLDVEDKGGIFVRSDTDDALEMRFTRGTFSDEFLQREARIPLGACLCGRAAVSGEVLVSDHCFHDARHEHAFTGMTPHGHYIVPLMAGGIARGVIFLYTAPYPPTTEARLAMLRDVGALLGLALVNEHQRAELILARERAETAMRVREMFLANMSHEIRTPMNAVIGFTELLAGTGLDLRQRGFVETVRYSAENLLALINDILDLSKLDSGHVELEFRPVDVARESEMAAQLLYANANAQGVDLRVEAASGLPECVLGDAVRLRQVLLNLIGNAVKFTANGHVTLRLSAQAAESDASGTLMSWITFAVEDSGKGIAPERLEAIFDRFTQADGSTSRRFGGSGLGLTISRQLVELMGGALTATSQVGQGSTFIARIPFRLAVHTASSAHAAAPPRLAEPQNLAASEARLRRASGVVARASADLPGGAAGPRSALHVLLVEDDPISRTLAVLVLEGMGCAVDAASSGYDALRHLAAGTYDAVLMDIQMPGLDGIATTAQIRERLPLLTAPIIAMTAHAMAGDRERFLAAGLDGYISKPIRPDVIAAALGLPAS